MAQPIYYATKKELDHTTGVDTSDLAARKICFFESLSWLTRHILVNVPTSLNNLKTKVDDLDVGKFKIVP